MQEKYGIPTGEKLSADTELYWDLHPVTKMWVYQTNSYMTVTEAAW
jgi:hypothetical protein